MSTYSALSRLWEKKSAEGKMFRRMMCERCASFFHFTDSPRATRSPRCPTCGSLSAHPLAA